MDESLRFYLAPPHLLCLNDRWAAVTVERARPRVDDNKQARQDNHPSPASIYSRARCTILFLSCAAPPQVEANIEVLWHEQLAKNPLLFNGSKFRLAGFSTEGDRKSSATVTATANAAGGAVSDTTDSSDGGGGGGRHTPPLPSLTNAARRRSRSPTSSPPTRKLRLRLGLTDYRSFRGESVRLALVGSRGDECFAFPSLSFSLSLCLRILFSVSTRPWPTLSFIKLVLP